MLPHQVLALSVAIANEKKIRAEDEKNDCIA
jgi:hypothetical protein